MGKRSNGEGTIYKRKKMEDGVRPILIITITDILYMEKHKQK